MKSDLGNSQKENNFWRFLKYIILIYVMIREHYYSWMVAYFKQITNNKVILKLD